MEKRLSDDTLSFTKVRLSEGKEIYLKLDDFGQYFFFEFQMALLSFHVFTSTPPEI